MKQPNCVGVGESNYCVLSRATKRLLRNSYLALLLSLVAMRAQAQVRPDSIRGAVTTDSAKPLRGVTVIATMAPDRTMQQAVTDSSGHYVIYFERGTGDYLVYAAQIGRAHV